MLGALPPTTEVGTSRVHSRLGLSLISSSLTPAPPPNRKGWSAVRKQAEDTGATVLVTREMGRNLYKKTHTLPPPMSRGGKKLEGVGRTFSGFMMAGGGQAISNENEAAAAAEVCHIHHHPMRGEQVYLIAEINSRDRVWVLLQVLRDCYVIAM